MSNSFEVGDKVSIDYVRPDGWVAYFSGDGVILDIREEDVCGVVLVKVAPACAWRVRSLHSNPPDRGRNRTECVWFDVRCLDLIK